MEWLTFDQTDPNAFSIKHSRMLASDSKASVFQTKLPNQKSQRGSLSPVALKSPGEL